MITLRELAAWEERLLRELGSRGGTLDQRDAEWVRRGLYADYAALFANYVELAERTEDPAIELEAVKRAAFLTWYEGAGAAPLTGLAELPAGAVDRALNLMEALCRGHRLDEEFGWMLAWYYAAAGPALIRRPDLVCLEGCARAADPGSWRRHPMDPASFGERGAMGRYWLDLRRAA